MAEASQSRGEDLIIKDRSSVFISDTEDIISFDGTGAVLRTGMGILALEGEDLHVVKLDTEGGGLLVAGKINGLFYSDGKTAGKRGRR